ncbi:PEP-CTERM protein-sorting domain-containing protein [Nitrosomonas sp. PY1]|uniref:PEP-CTERM sorting domain-containing protein n=1 Tax=Nitrosomonas sp. PY1 TaxID=1803906 RepID=UPI001FC80AA4|nr:PEP-CTERM sorting domain-containing protein [Nitrosomonas sp. PY1]GKS70146.1 PEP-CTERM protein-sorting domain-containing protein [Nitrosomonas sp. PY1]
MNSQPRHFKLIASFKLLFSMIFYFSSTSLYANWSFTELGSLGGNQSKANAINDSGQIVGQSVNAAGESKAFIIQSNGAGMTTLFPSINASNAQDINDAGQITGTYYLPTLPGQGESPFHAFITGANGQGIIDLEVGSKMNSGISINNAGQVLGRTFEMDGSSSTFITSANGMNVRTLETFNDKSIIPAGINEHGQIAGWAGDWSMPKFSVITAPNGVDMHEIKGLPGSNGVTAFGINNAGQVVGSVDIQTDSGGNLAYAFLTSADGNNMMNLGVLKGDDSSSAVGMNDLGEVIGSSSSFDVDHSRIFLYSHGGMTDLSALDVVTDSGWRDLFISDINNHGQMVGFGTNKDGATEAFLLSYTADTIFNPQPIYIPPVPEPETYMMLLIGLGLIGWFVRRQRSVAH